MADYTVRWIIGRALTDPAYRALLFSDPDMALAGYELTDEDFASLREWGPQRFEALLEDLEARIARATFDGTMGFVFEEPAAATGCEEGIGLADLKRFFQDDESPPVGSDS